MAIYSYVEHAILNDEQQSVLRLLKKRKLCEYEIALVRMVQPCKYVVKLRLHTVRKYV